MLLSDPIYDCVANRSRELDRSGSDLRAWFAIITSDTSRAEKLIEAWIKIECIIAASSLSSLALLLKSNQSILPTILNNSTRAAYNAERVTWLSAMRCLIAILRSEIINLSTNHSELIMLVADNIEVFGIIQETIESTKGTTTLSSSHIRYFEEQITCLMAAAAIIQRFSHLSGDDSMKAMWVEALEVFACATSVLWSSLHKHLLLMYSLHMDGESTSAALTTEQSDDNDNNNKNEDKNKNNDSTGSMECIDCDFTTHTTTSTHSSPASAPANRNPSALPRIQETTEETSLAVLPTTAQTRLLNALFTSNKLRQLLCTAARKASACGDLQLNRSTSCSMKLSADHSGKYTSAHTSVDTTSLSSSTDIVNNNRAHFIELASAPCMMENTMYFDSLDYAENAAYVVPSPTEVISSIYTALYYMQQVLMYVQSLERDTTAIMAACRRGDTQAVCALLGAYPLMVHNRNEDNQTIVHRCVMLDCSQSGAEARQISPARANNNNNSNTNPYQGNSASGLSSQDNTSQKQPRSTSPSLLRTMLTFPFNVDALDNAGRTALHYCATPSAVATLCQHGADVNVADERGFTPLMQYVLCGYADCVRTILQYRADAAIAEPLKNRNCLHFAATLGQYSMLEAIVASGSVDVNKKDAHGNTALHLAAACEFAGSEPMTMILYLVNHGALVTAKNNAGITMLHLVCANQSLSPVKEPLVDMILHHGADPNAADADGCTPLIVACAHREFALCKLLLLHGGDLNIPCSMSSTFLTIGFIDGDHDFQDDNLQDTLEATDTSSSQKSQKSATKVEVNDAITASDLLPKKPRYEVFSCISTLQSKIRTVIRDRCMNCGDYYDGEGPAASFVAALNLTTGLSAGRHHCRHCRRVVCLKCASHFCSAEEVPDFVRAEYGAAESTYRVCEICYDVLTDRAAQADIADEMDATTITTAEGDLQNVDSHSSPSTPNKGEQSPVSYFSFSAFSNTMKSVF